MCKRCARGLFGITQLELSEDGTRCVNVTLKWWYMFYSITGLLIVALVTYVVSLAWRPPEAADCEEKLKKAQNHREAVRTEMMHANEDMQNMWRTSFHSVNTAAKRGGQGIVLYFNWLIFGMIVSLTLAGGNFIAWELSDLGRHTQIDKSCMVTDPIETYDQVTISTYENMGTSAHRTQRHGLLEYWSDWGHQITDAVRASMRIMVNEAPPTGSAAERYDQYHQRMFKASIAIYIVVVAMMFAFNIYQNGWVTARLTKQEPQARGYAAVVSGLPKDLFHGTYLTAFFREVFAKENLTNLWEIHGGCRRDELKDVPLEDRFWVVGTSIAYDYNLQQEAIEKEVQSWVYDLELQSSSPPELNVKYDLASRAVSGALPTDTKSRGIQTETRGDILEQLRDVVPPQNLHPMFDQALLKIVGLEEEREPTLHGSGKAFVVFATEAARDAAVSLSHSKDFPRFTKPIQRQASALNKSNEPLTYKLAVEAAHCEPVSVKWENFGPLSNFVMKLAMSMLMIVLTMFVWIALSLPSAIFIADLALIPGIRPGFVQNLILGLLIALGNQLIAIVVDLVTSWMGFLYKDSRDVAVLALAFMGTLVATVFDLSVVAITAHGMVLEDAFHGRDAGYEPVVANEIFGLTVPGYLILPYLGMPIGEHVLPYFLAKFLIRSHSKVTLRSATRAMKSADFDICWRYSDILNNTTICVVLLFFTSNRAWMTMSVLFLFMAIIYAIDKYLLMFVSTPTVYDTHRLSEAFALWWCLPTTMLAGLVSWWGYRSSNIQSYLFCFAIPFAHALLYLIAMNVLNVYLLQTDEKDPVLYPDMIRRLQKAGKPWDYFNTNPVFCLRTRYLGAEATGWKEVERFQHKVWSGGSVPGSPIFDDEKQADECLPFVRGSLRVLDPVLARSGSGTIGSRSPSQGPLVMPGSPVV
jgi:hypothetical protein